MAVIKQLVIHCGIFNSDTIFLKVVYMLAKTASLLYVVKINYIAQFHPHKPIN